MESTEQKPEKIEYEKRWCKYEFSDDEKKEIAEKLAIQTQQLAEVESEKKAVMSSYKERLERIQGDVNKAASLYKDGYEMRDIECMVERDFETGEVRYIRTDTGLVAHRDKMTMVERQRRIEEMLPKEKPAGQEKSNEEIRREQEIQREMRNETSAL